MAERWEYFRNVYLAYLLTGEGLFLVLSFSLVIVVALVFEWKWLTERRKNKQLQEELRRVE